MLQRDFQNERFNRIFDMVIVSLPSVHQQKIQNALRLVTDRAEVAEANGVQAAKAAVAHRGGGVVMFVNANELQRESDQRIAGVMAHEFAHLVLGHTSAKSATPETRWLEDCHCDELAGAWGFERTVQAMANEGADRIRIHNQWN